MREQLGPACLDPEHRDLLPRRVTLEVTEGADWLTGLLLPVKSKWALVALYDAEQRTIQLPCSHIVSGQPIGRQIREIIKYHKIAERGPILIEL